MSDATRIYSGPLGDPATTGAAQLHCNGSFTTWTPDYGWDAWGDTTSVWDNNTASVPPYHVGPSPLVHKAAPGEPADIYRCATCRETILDSISPALRETYPPKFFNKAFGL